MPVYWTLPSQVCTFRNTCLGADFKTVINSSIIQKYKYWFIESKLFFLTRAKAKLSHQIRVTSTESVRELCYESLKVLPTLLRSMNVSEELSQCIWQELISEVVQRHKVIQNISPSRIKSHIIREISFNCINMKM